MDNHKPIFELTRSLTPREKGTETLQNQDNSFTLHFRKSTSAILALAFHQATPWPQALQFLYEGCQ
jgi:hypothetical protein